MDSALAGVNSTLFLVWLKGLKDHSAEEETITPEQLDQATRAVQQDYLCVYGFDKYRQAIMQPTQSWSSGYVPTLQQPSKTINKGDLGTITISVPSGSPLLKYLK